MGVNSNLDLSTYDTIHDILLSSYSDLIQKVNNENDDIDKQTANYQQQHSVDYKKSVYESESTEYLHSIYNYLFYIYYFIVLILFFYMVMNNVFFNINNFIIINILFFFPFIIVPIENFLMYIFRYLASFFQQDVYMM
jgi:hypothetical protein